jgi:hypothetical protein
MRESSSSAVAWAHTRKKPHREAGATCQADRQRYPSTSTSPSFPHRPKKPCLQSSAPSSREAVARRRRRRSATPFRPSTSDGRHLVHFAGYERHVGPVPDHRGGRGSVLRADRTLPKWPRNHAIPDRRTAATRPDTPHRRGHGRPATNGNGLASPAVALVLRWVPPPY